VLNKQNSAHDIRTKIGIVIGQLSEGGAERQVVALARGLQASSIYEPIVFSLSDYIEPNGVSLINSGIKTFYYPNHKNSLDKLIWLIRKLKESNCALIYGILNIGNIYGGFASRLIDVPFIASIRSANPGLTWVIRILSSIMCLLANCVIANSPSCLNSLRKDLRIYHNRVSLIPNMVHMDEPDKEAVAIIRSELGISEYTKVIGCVSRLKPEKRVGFFLEMSHFIYLSSENKDLQFLWVGDGPEKTKIPELLEVMPDEMRTMIHFVGAKTNVSDWFSVMDIFVLTSIYEGLPNALLEAMAAGLPCIATNVSGTKDVLSVGEEGEVIGILSDPNSPQNFAKDVLELLIDTESMKRIGKSAQEHVKAKYSQNKMVKAHCLVFDEVLNHKKKKVGFYEK
jgi:L-malate glycosyltransferase